MKQQLTLAALLAASLALTACAKQESAPESEVEGSAPVAAETVSPEQQTAIEGMTGLPVVRVNVHIAGVDIEKA